MLKGKTPLVVAVVLGLLAFFVSYSAIERKKAEAKEGWNLVPVLVANVDISEGTTLTSEMLAQNSIPEQFVTASVVTPAGHGTVVGQKVLVTLNRGDPLLWTQLDSNRAVEKLSTTIQKTRRAVTISAKANQAVGGWVRPNDHVDIIGTFKGPDGQQLIATTLMQDVVVLATGKITGNTSIALIPESQREYSDVSLHVMPEEAEILVLAQELGTLTLSLRHPEDVATVATTEGAQTTMKTLLSGERTKELEKVRRQAPPSVYAPGAESTGNAPGTHE